MVKLSIKEVIFHEFEGGKQYTLNEVANIFSQYYNIDIEEFTFVGYSYNEVVTILKDNKIGDVINENVLLLKKDIWEVFLNIFSQIELNTKKIKISKKIYMKVVSERKNSIAKILKSRKKGNLLELDELIIDEILSKIFPRELDYTYQYGGKENITKILEKNKVEYNEKESKFIVEIINVNNILEEVFDCIEVTQEVYYSIKDIERRLKYPADLDNYYIDSPWIYHGKKEWIDYSSSRIQEIIKKDYEGESEFFKIGNWKIYGSDEQYKDEKGKYKIPKERSSEIRPEGHKVNKGKLQYLMNSIYCRYLLLELGNRILHKNYKYSLSELEDKIGKLSSEEIINYSAVILKELNNKYTVDIQDIISDNNIKIQNYKNIIERIQKYREDNTLRKLEGYKELKSNVSKLEKLNYKAPTDDILANVKTILEENNKDYAMRISKKLYNKQIRNNDNLEKFKRKSYELQGECSRIIEVIKNNLQQQRKKLKQEKLIIFDLYFNGIIQK